MTNWREKLRRWIDGEKDLATAEQALQDSKNKVNPIVQTENSLF